MFRFVKNNNKGITLVALIVTIIVLLILASITLATLSGDHGIITHAENAKNKTEQSEQKENQIINDILGYVNSINGVTPPIGDNTVPGGTTCTHSWNTGVVTTAATCTSTGIRTKTCTKCGATTTELIAKDANNHSGTLVKTATSVTTSETINNASLYYTSISYAPTITDPIYHKVTQKYNCCGATVGNDTYELHSGIEGTVTDNIDDGVEPEYSGFYNVCPDCSADINGVAALCLDEGYNATELNHPNTTDISIAATNGHSWSVVEPAGNIYLYSIAHEHYDGWFYDALADGTLREDSGLTCYCHWWEKYLEEEPGTDPNPNPGGSDLYTITLDVTDDYISWNDPAQSKVDYDLSNQITYELYVNGTLKNDFYYPSEGTYWSRELLHIHDNGLYMVKGYFEGELISQGSVTWDCTHSSVTHFSGLIHKCDTCGDYLECTPGSIGITAYTNKYGYIPELGLVDRTEEAWNAMYTFWECDECGEHGYYKNEQSGTV